MRSDILVVTFVIGVACGIWYKNTQFVSEHKQDLEYGAEVKKAIRNCEMSYTIPRPCKPIFTATGIDP